MPFTNLVSFKKTSERIMRALCQQKVKTEKKQGKKNQGRTWTKEKAMENKAKENKDLCCFCIAQH